ncbi:alpha/beta hydrolase fold domain-containing protein [Nocardia sp. NPDC052254]|uniref:alpha/beta hydrolase fold domain-containing protein n=1 Tax=Nocardia sp. NPDC052254 TaxID=3155681 RepID=UPI0034286D7C
MYETTAQRPPEPDWTTVTDEELITYREAENRFRASPGARAIIGFPDPGATIEWEHIALPGRDLPVRVYRPSTGSTDLPVVLHVHGGGFVGTAAQCDWANSYLAAHLPAVVVSVEHRLLDSRTPLPAAVADGWDALGHILGNTTGWGLDPTRIALLGESCGALISALIAIRAREAGLRLRAQVLVNPAVDVTGTMLDYPSITAQAQTSGLVHTRFDTEFPLFRRLAAPPGTDPRAVSPLYADVLADLAPALVLVPTEVRSPIMAGAMSSGSVPRARRSG